MSESTAGRLSDGDTERYESAGRTAVRPFLHRCQLDIERNGGRDVSQEAIDLLLRVKAELDRRAGLSASS